MSRQLDNMTGSFTVPDGACRTWQALYAGTAKLANGKACSAGATIRLTLYRIVRTRMRCSGGLGTVTVAEHFWRGLGLISTGLGVVGTVLPLVPTTPFLLVAAYAFARSSPRLLNWLLHHPHFGPLIINWRHHRAISRRTKIASLVLMASMVLAGWLARLSSPVVTAQAMIMGCVALFILTRPNAPHSQG